MTAAGAPVPAPPALSVAARLSATAPCAGAPVLVVLTITNAGGEAERVAVGFLASSTSAAFAVSEEPTPRLPRRLGPGHGGSFTWTLTAAAGGPVALTASVTAFGADGAPAWWGVALPPVVPRRPGALGLGLAMPTRASVGQWFTVAVTVSNTGDAPVEGASVVLRFPTETAAPQGGPADLPLPEMPPGAARRLVWTVSVSAAGDLPFTAAASGLTCGAWTVTATAGRSVRCVTPARLEAAIRVSATRLIVGQWVRVTMSVSNAGGADARGVHPDPLATSLIMVHRDGPEPRLLADLGPGAATAFVWTYSVSGAGATAFTGRIVGHDGNSGARLDTPWLGTDRLTLLTPADLRVESLFLLPNPTVNPGSFLTAILLLANKGTAQATVKEFIPRAKTTKNGALGDHTLFAPTLPFDLEGGEVRTVIWSYRVGDEGRVTLTVSVSGSEELTGRDLKLPGGPSNAVEIQQATTVRAL